MVLLLRKKHCNRDACTRVHDHARAHDHAHAQVKRRVRKAVTGSSDRALRDCLREAAVVKAVD